MQRLLLKTTSEVDMVATSHDVMPDIELYQPTDEAAPLRFICTKKDKTIPSLNRAIINLTFLQVFEPA